MDGGESSGTARFQIPEEIPNHHGVLSIGVPVIKQVVDAVRMGFGVCKAPTSQHGFWFKELGQPKGFQSEPGVLLGVEGEDAQAAASGLERREQSLNARGWLGLHGQIGFNFLKTLAERLGLFLREGVEGFHDGLPLWNAEFFADGGEIVNRDRQGAVHIEHPVAALEEIRHASWGGLSDAACPRCSPPSNDP